MRLAGKKKTKKKHTEHERVHFFGTTEHERATLTRTHNVQIEAPTKQYYPIAIGVCVHAVFLRTHAGVCSYSIYAFVCDVCVETAEKERERERACVCVCV